MRTQSFIGLFLLNPHMEWSSEGHIYAFITRYYYKCDTVPHSQLKVTRQRHGGATKMKFCTI